MNPILLAVIFLGVIGAIGAVILYAASKKFEVYEDPKIGQILEVLPLANCGGCGFPGCNGFATACAGADDLDGLLCPVGGQETMTKVAGILGKTAKAVDPKIAVVRCNGSCDHRPRTNRYDGAATCAIASALYAGNTACGYGCLGMGDCTTVCTFGAIRINASTLLPEVDEDKCTACGACIKVCPKSIIELRKKGRQSRRVYVNCVNKDKGAVARKACAVACIACSKCQKVCPSEAISMVNNLAYIDDDKCSLCLTCVGECPTAAIIALNVNS
ncbi:MAG: Electron transport complex subunit RsxB [Candidatus Ordinivivax streblomastigis]|uniref:Ion-translocating oxidoreductase complex subunit B n=1 Tax=Candidatus Ordinivivax streblomastigis TaxID=2540710 RepID=A0A5M8P446_9BACT|nr:MAG: Electron transport complex subunit RsxB [Candidatus Ordinivivax streblomastigis]